MTVKQLRGEPVALRGRVALRDREPRPLEEARREVVGAVAHGLAPGPHGFARGAQAKRPALGVVTPVAARGAQDAPPVVGARVVGLAALAEPTQALAQA